jgi:hypothetical protein
MGKVDWMDSADIVTDREDQPTAWVVFEPSFGWVVYPLGYFRLCIPQDGNGPRYTSANHGLAFGCKLPDDPWALPHVSTRIRFE